MAVGSANAVWSAVALRTHLGLGVALLSCAGAAHAQDARKLDISVSSRLEYDTNVLRGSNGLAGGREGDFRWSPSLDLDIAYPLGRQSVYLEGSIGYDFYRKNDQFDRERINLEGGAVFRVSVCTPQVGVGYSRRLSDLADLIDGPSSTNTEERRTYSASVSCGASTGLSSSVGYIHEDVSNSQLVRRSGNIRSDTYRASIGYMRPTFGNLSIYGTYRKGTYPDRDLGGLLPAGDGIQVYSVGGSFDRQIGSRLRGTVSLGYTKVDPTLPTTPSFSGLSYSGDISWTTDRASIMLGFSRDAEQSNLLAVSYAITSRFQIDGEYAFSERLRFTAGAYYSKRAFETSSLIPGAIARSNDRTYYGYAGLRYIPMRRLSFDLRVTREQRDTGDAFFGYSSTRIGLTTRLSI